MRGRLSVRVFLLGLLLGCLVVTWPAAHAASTDISGTWRFTWDTEGGVRQSTMELKQSGETLTAKTDQQTLSGSIKDDAFQLSGNLYSAEAGSTDVMKVEGKVDGPRLIGKGSWGAHPMTFTAVRVD